MKKLKEIINRPLVFALLLNAGALLVSLIIYKPFFEENDDAFLSMIAEGAYGAKETHLIYTNVLLGSVYKALYSVCSCVRWHAMLQYLFLFVAFTVLTYVLTRYRFGKIISSIIVLSSFYEVYVSIQYSKSATVISVIGYTVLFIVLKNVMHRVEKLSREDKLLSALAYILLVYGMLLRDSSFYLATLFMIPVGLYLFITAVKENNFLKAFNGYLVAFAPILILLIVFSLVNQNAYNRDADWKSFMTYNDTRMELLDYRYDLLDYVKYGESLDKMGISENDAILYLTWQFGDDRVLDTAAMREILDAGSRRKVNAELIKAFVKNVYDDCFVVNPLVVGVVLMTLLLLLILIRSEKKSAELILVVAELCLFAGILAYYQYSGRWSHRIVFAALLVFPVIFGMLIATRTESMADFTLGYARDVSMVMIILAAVGVLLTNRFDYNEWKREPEYRSYLASINADKDTLHVADTFTFQRAYRFDVFRPYSEGSLDNFVAVGSWFMNSPVTKRITEHYGYSNPYEALAAGSDNVILIDNGYAKEKLEFLNAHYAGSYELTDEKEEMGFTTYKIKER